MPTFKRSPLTFFSTMRTLSVYGTALCGIGLGGLTLSGLIGCGSSSMPKSTEASPATIREFGPSPFPSPAQAQGEFKLSHRVSSQITIDDQVIEVATISELSVVGMDAGLESRETYIVRKGRQVFAVQVYKDHQDHRKRD